MNKTAKGIIALGAVLALLGGGYAALRLTEPKEESGSSASSEVTEDKKSVIIIQDDATEDTASYHAGVIKTVDVKNKTEELHVVQKSTKTEESAALYTLDGYQDVTMNDSIIGTLANNANELTSEDVIAENVTDLAKYGLASPSVTVDIEFESGKKIRMLIGSPAPTGDVTYVMIDGVNTVYTVRNSALDNYTKTAKSLVSSTVLESPDELPIVKTLKIERNDIDYDILLKYDESNDDSQRSGGTSAAHVMVEPTSAYLAVERATDITTGMFGLTAEEIYSVHCTDADIAEAGLKDPFCTVTMECDDGNTHVLLLSEPFTDSENGKCCYAMLKDGNVIYTVSTENAKWATTKPIDIASKIFIASYVWNISDLKVSCDGAEGEFKLTKKFNGEEKDSYTSDDFKATYNDKEIESERFRKFYSFLISANAEDFALDAKIPDSAPMAAVEFDDSYTHEHMKLEFYDNTSMTALIVINGESKFTITKSYVETLIGNIKKIEGEEEFVTTWK